MYTSIVVFAVVVLGVAAFEPPEIMKPMIEECRKEYGIEEAVLKAREPLPADKKCFHFCVAQKVGFMDKDGNVLLSSFKKSMGPNMPEDMLKSVEKCSSINKNDKCLTAEAICNCMHS